MTSRRTRCRPCTRRARSTTASRSGGLEGPRGRESSVLASFCDFQLELARVVDELLGSAAEDQCPAALESRAATQRRLLRLPQDEPDLVVEGDRVADAQRLVCGDDLLVLAVEHELVQLHVANILRPAEAASPGAGWARPVPRCLRELPKRGTERLARTSTE